MIAFKMPMAIAMLAALIGCGASNSTVCADGRLCPPGTQCDGDRCVASEQLEACAPSLAVAIGLAARVCAS